MKKQIKTTLRVGIIIGGFAILLIAPILYFTFDCLKIEEEYKANQVLASDKYGFQTFLQWRIENEYYSNCIPTIPQRASG